MKKVVFACVILLTLVSCKKTGHVNVIIPEKLILTPSTKLRKEMQRPTAKVKYLRELFLPEEITAVL